jgi:hypothetical protein
MRKQMIEQAVLEVATQFAPWRTVSSPPWWSSQSFRRG